MFLHGLCHIHGLLRPPSPRHRPGHVREGHQGADHDDHAEPSADGTEGHELQGTSMEQMGWSGWVGLDGKTIGKP